MQSQFKNLTDNLKEVIITLLLGKTETKVAMILTDVGATTRQSFCSPVAVESVFQAAKSEMFY